MDNNTYKQMDMRNYFVPESVSEKLKKNAEELNDAFKREFYGEETTRKLMAETDIKCADEIKVKVEKEGIKKQKENIKKIKIDLPNNTRQQRETKIILKYNDDYINIVKEMFNTINMTVLNNRDINIFREIQSKIRSYCRDKKIKKTFPRIEGIKKDRFGKPDGFVTALTAISNTENCKSFDDIIQQNRSSKFRILSVDLYNEKKEYILEHCVCGQENHLRNMYAMENTQTGLHLLIGSDCIKKWNLATPGQLKKIKDDHDTKKEEIKNKWINLVKKLKMNNMRSIFDEMKEKDTKNCTKCNKVFKPIDATHKLCIGCYFVVINPIRKKCMVIL